MIVKVGVGVQTINLRNQFAIKPSGGLCKVKEPATMLSRSQLSVKFADLILKTCVSFADP